MDLGFNLYSSRMRAVLKSKQAAELMGISQARLSNYENNHAEPPISVLLKMSATYGATLDTLVNGVKA